MNNLILFISGKAHSGKDTLLEVIKNSQSLKVNHLAFADEVKREYCRLNTGVSFERLVTDNEYKSLHRKGLVEIGDGYRQKFGSFIWIDKHEEHMKPLVLNTDFEVFGTTDTRYRNELDYSKACQNGFKDDIVLSIRLIASLPVRLARMESVDAMVKYMAHGRNNGSETDLDGCDDKFDFVIDNNQNVQDHEVFKQLQKKVEPILEICHVINQKKYSTLVKQR